MTKLSASTLSRQAAILQKKGLGRLAKIKREQAAKLRRDGRAAKKPRAAAKIMVGLKQALVHEINRAANVDAMTLTQTSAEQPGHGEIVGGRLSTTAGILAKLARKKGGVDEIQQTLSNIEANARYEGGQAADDRFRKERTLAYQLMRDQAVCAFVALYESGDPSNEQVCKVSGFTMRLIIDALNAAGYSAFGKR
jgi:ATP/maltotriose-dependent transcriptional regulator MalT